MLAHSRDIWPMIMRASAWRAHVEANAEISSIPAGAMRGSALACKEETYLPSCEEDAGHVEWFASKCCGPPASSCRVNVMTFDGYTFVGHGLCLDGTKDGGDQFFPSLYKEGALQSPADHEMELKDLCDKYPDCVGIDLNNDHNGYLLFRSVAALDAVSEPGWDKWSPSSAMEEGVCVDDCAVTASTGEELGVCHAKTTGKCAKTSHALLLQYMYQI
jgi:hypothetical protein